MVGQISPIRPLASSVTDKLHTQGTRFKPIDTSTVEEFSLEVKKHLPILVCRVFESKDPDVGLYLINQINFPPPPTLPLSTQLKQIPVPVLPAARVLSSTVLKYFAIDTRVPSGNNSERLPCGS